MSSCTSWVLGTDSEKQAFDSPEDSLYPSVGLIEVVGADPLVSIPSASLVSEPSTPTPTPTATRLSLMQVGLNAGSAHAQLLHYISSGRGAGGDSGGSGVWACECKGTQ